MAADYNKPVTTDNYADILTQLRDNIAAAQNMLNNLTGVTNIPTGALRYDQTAKKFQTYNGTTFVDTVLSKEAGGTGITNWVKATTGEAEAGTPDKYPDAAGVLASIAANGFKGDNTTLIWSGSTTSLDLNSLIGGYPGDGLYLVKQAGQGVTLMYFLDGVNSYGLSGFYVSEGLKRVTTYTIKKSFDNILTATGGDVNLSSTSTSNISGGIIEVKKLVQS